MNDIKNFGLLQPKDVSAKDWRAGGISAATRTILRADGQYLDIAPTKEYQIGLYFDTMACVSFSALNCLEIAYRAHTGIEVNFSDRFTAKMSGTTEKGNYLITVAGSIDKDGVVPEEDWTWTPRVKDPIFTWDDFYSEIPDEIKQEGKDWLKEWDVQYEWVELEDLKEALKYGPVQVTVKYANSADVIPNPSNKYRNHAVTVIGYKEGEFYYIFDHYDRFIKKFAWDYEFGALMQYHLVHKTTENMPNVKLADNTFVQLVEGKGGFGMVLNDKIIVDDLAKIQASWIQRNAKDGKFDGGAVRALSQADWDSFEKVNLKGESV